MGNLYENLHQWKLPAIRYLTVSIIYYCMYWEQTLTCSCPIQTRRGFEWGQSCELLRPLAGVRVGRPAVRWGWAWRWLTYPESGLTGSECSPPTSTQCRLEGERGPVGYRDICTCTYKYIRRWHSFFLLLVVSRESLQTMRLIISLPVILNQALKVICKLYNAVQFQNSTTASYAYRAVCIVLRPSVYLDWVLVCGWTHTRPAPLVHLWDYALAWYSGGGEQSH